MARPGRKSLFRGKWQGGKEGGPIHRRLSAVLTSKGWDKLEEHRRALAEIADRDPKHVSDGDTVEYLARGGTETRRALKAEDS